MRRGLAGLILPLLLAVAGGARAQEMPAMPGMDHASMAGMKMNPPEVGMAGISGARGFYPFERDSSGSSWQPDASVRRSGLRLDKGAWLFSFNSLLQVGYARLDGFQTTSQGFTASMLSAAARRDLGNMDVIQVRLRVRPNTAVASTFANPRDRQPPSAIVSEISASYSHRLNFTDTVFLYGAVQGQPALGPPVYFDRQSSGDSPLAPIDLQRPEPAEAAAGVLTGGWTHGDWKLEGSGFKGRAPRPDRLATPDLDSWAVRLSVNPTKNLALQTSWAVLTSPNSLLPAINPNIWSTSAIYTQSLGAAGWWSTTAAITRISAKQIASPMNDWLLESAASTGGAWTVFARAEQAELRALTSPRVPVQTVRKLSLGAVHDWTVREHVRLGLGGLYALGGPSAALKGAYGARPSGTMVFLRLRLG